MREPVAQDLRRRPPGRFRSDRVDSGTGTRRRRDRARGTVRGCPDVGRGLAARRLPHPAGRAAARQQQGLDPAVNAPVATIGHSQGLIAAAAVAAARLQRTARCSQPPSSSGAAAGLVGRRRGIIAGADRSPMLAVSNVDPERLAVIVAELAEGQTAERAAVLAIRNGRRRVVLSGPPAQLARVQQRCEQIAADEAVNAMPRPCGAVFSPVFESLSVEIGFHHPALAEAVDIIGGWATRCGLDADQVRGARAGPSSSTRSLGRRRRRRRRVGARWILDLGPGDLLTA